MAAVVVAVSAVSGGCLGGKAASPVARVVTTEMEFSPASLKVAAGLPTEIIVDNRGDVAHTFSVNELGLEVKVSPGDEGRLTLDAPAAEYEFVCRILDHEGLGMVGQLVVS